jgi:uncharacterized membrane protein
MRTGKIFEIIWVAFSIAFFTVLILFLALNFVFGLEVYYLGLATLVLFIPFLLSLAYVMAIGAKRTMDKEIEKEEEAKQRLAEMLTEDKNNNA